MPDDVVPPFDLAGCLDRVRQRDQAAARELVDHLYPLVIRIVRSHLPRRVAEEDLTQEVFMKMFTRLAQYQGAVPFSHWVSRIAVTTCIDDPAQKRRPEFRWADLSENEADVLDAVMTNENDVPANDAMAAHELVHKLLNQLKPDDQLVIRLLDLEQKTIAEIAALTGWNQSLIKVRVFRARRKLQKLFQELTKGTLMNHISNDPRRVWTRLTSAARTVGDDRDTAAPYGFATRVAALALAQERAVVSLIELFALRALGVSCLLALFSVALNYGLIGSNAEEEFFPATDAVAVVFDLAD